MTDDILAVHEASFDEVLAHYGVKGMKWGVRKDRSTSSKPSYSVDGEGRITIQKGYEVQRVFDSRKSSSGESGANYFSFTEKDKNVYIKMMAAGIDSKIGVIRKLASDKVSVMVAQEDLKSPSREEAFNLLKKSVDEAGPDRGVPPFKKDFSDEGALAWYQEANTHIVLNRGSELSKTYFSNLRKSGYNILLDEMDSGFLSDLPIIVLDGSKSLRPLRVSDVRGHDVKAAKAFLKEHQNSTVRDLEYYSKKP